VAPGMVVEHQACFEGFQARQEGPLTPWRHRIAALGGVSRRSGSGFEYQKSSMGELLCEIQRSRLAPCGAGAGVRGVSRSCGLMARSRSAAEAHNEADFFWNQRYPAGINAP
jgi:hypothetical protein